MQSQRRRQGIAWAYAVTTVPARVNDLLPRTLRSLTAAGFDRPTLFVDGDASPGAYRHMFGLPVTVRSERVQTFSHWFLTLAELYLTNPTAERFAIFQDDLITCRNLRPYLEACHFPDCGYWNLYTFPSNEGECGWHEGALLNPAREDRFQTGRGAVGLVFSRAGARVLLSCPALWDRTTDPHHGHRKVDGAVVNQMNQAGWREWVHSPSLTQHMGLQSSMGNRPHLQAVSFRGEEFDCMSLLDRQP